MPRPLHKTPLCHRLPNGMYRVKFFGEGVMSYQAEKIDGQWYLTDGTGWRDLIEAPASIIHATNIDGLPKFLPEKKKPTVFMRAITKWGIPAQARQAMEECGELIVALNKYFFRDSLYKEALAEEVADVEIMCQQIREIIGHDLVDSIARKKINRLKERLDET